MLIAVSTTNDPTGTWYAYSFDVADTPDYEKFGIWQDGYYMGTNNSASYDIYVFERSQMLQGLSAQGVGFNNPCRPTTLMGLCVCLRSIMTVLLPLPANRAFLSRLTMTPSRRQRRALDL